MLRITKQTDYGIMLLARMAELPEGQLLSTRDAATWSGISRPMVSKILKILAREGIIESYRGVGGGYSLPRPADETTVAAVIRALEGPISIVQCGIEPGNCEQEQICPARVNWARINREIESALERVPISEMVSLPRTWSEAAPAPLLTAPPGKPDVETSTAQPSVTEKE